MLNLRDVVFLSSPPPLHHQPPPPPSAAVGLGVSIIPLLSCLPSTSTVPTTTTLDFQVHPDPHPNRDNNDNAASNLWSFSRKDAFSPNRQDGADRSLDGREAMLKVCRDCGNRAKKECMHQRCRTCCRNHGYDCPSHLKSTWLPAARRKERKQQHNSHNQSQNQGQGQEFVAAGSSGIAKRQRLDNAATGSSASNAATPRSFDTISCPQGQVQAPAMFRCIRVTMVSDNTSEIVYQATVTISGHVFKGFLYDQGSKNPISCIS